jgi:hypothetical protein
MDFLSKPNQLTFPDKYYIYPYMVGEIEIL